jgi:hypothetical protein
MRRLALRRFLQMKREPIPIHTHTEGWARSLDALSEVETRMEDKILENEGDLERLAAARRRRDCGWIISAVPGFLRPSRSLAVGATTGLAGSAGRRVAAAKKI